MPNIFIENRGTPFLASIKPLIYGSFALDDGNYTLSEDEYNSIIEKEPAIEKYLKLFIGSKEFINSIKRYCVWLYEANLADVRNSKILMEKIENVKIWRSKSKRKETVAAADVPMLFAEIRQPSYDYLAIPITSSERRKYIPIGYLTKDIIASNHMLVLPDATLYEFGILTSSVHMAWMRMVGGRLKSDYNYSARIVYNNFPWPDAIDEPKVEIEILAQGILEAREKYPDSSLADLYDPLTMPPDLLKAHKALDKAVMKLYRGWGKWKSEADCVLDLMERYKQLMDDSHVTD